MAKHSRQNTAWSSYQSSYLPSPWETYLQKTLVPVNSQVFFLFLIVLFCFNNQKFLNWERGYFQYRDDNYFGIIPSLGVLFYSECTEF